MKVNSRPKMILASLLAGVIALSAPAATVFAGYAPSARATFQCTTPTDCNGANYVTFNSFTNAPNYGDERAFVDAKDASDTATGNWLDNVNVHDGEKVTVRVYIHNNANPNANGKDAATAHNTKLQVLLPGNTATSLTAAAQISADNANPGTVSDTVDLAGASPFSVTFDKTAPVSMTYRPNGTGDFVTRAIPTASFSNDLTMNANFGDWNGCFNYSALVTMTVIVHMPTPPVTPPVTPPATTVSKKPTTLVNTGAGSTIAIFAAATVAGAVGYRVYLGRRLSRQ